mmetsp:Transcript_16820/g.38850  ORF Transcript_16820/g.38850 Transcript_16820/m.38850 type:complete len:307 (-) Transcript_16820:36-956(-)
MSKTLQHNLKKKIPNATEWDSSDDDDDDSPKNASKQQLKVRSSKSPKGKKNVKYDKIRQDDEGDSNEEKGLVLYIGHLPKDFEESDVRRFLSQFGKVYNCRVARKLETGRAKGYAFVRFGDEETSKIVCETLHGYFLEKQRLVCQLRPSHPGMFFNTNEIIDTRKKNQKIEAKQRSRNLSDAEKLKKITSRLVGKEMKKRERLKALGIDYDFPGYKSNQSDFEAEFVAKAEKNQADIHKEDGGGSAEKKKRRKELIDSTRSDGSATKKKKRKDSIDSAVSSSSSKKEGSKDTPSKKGKKKKRSSLS